MNAFVVVRLNAESESAVLVDVGLRTLGAHQLKLEVDLAVLLLCTGVACFKRLHASALLVHHRCAGLVLERLRIGCDVDEQQGGKRQQSGGRHLHAWPKRRRIA